MRKNKTFSIKNIDHMSHPPIHLTTNKEILIYIPILVYFFLSIILPIIYLSFWAIKNSKFDQSQQFNFAMNTITVGILSAGIITIGSFLYSYLSRSQKHSFFNLLRPLELMGYSLPGPIIAISFIGLTSLLNNLLDISIITSGYPLLFLAIFYRYIFIGERNWSSHFSRISKESENIVRVLGLGLFDRFKLTVLPILNKYYLPIFILVFLEVIKELPITLILRPFGLNTLSTNIYELTSEGEWEKAAMSSLLLLAIGIPASLMGIRRKKS